MITEPGFYDLTDEEYHGDPLRHLGGSLSSTGAKRLLACPAKFEYERKNPPPTKKAFEIGKAAHRLVLGTGPDLVDMGPEDWRGKKADAVAAVRESGAVPLKTAEFEQVQAMAAAIRAHDLAGALFTPGLGVAERALIWQDEATGVWCRAKPDWWLDPYIVDYKGLALDTPIPTVRGWSTIGALAVGDQVFDSQGQPCMVTHKSEVHQRSCYRVRFDDGSSVVCDDEHLWVTTSGQRGNRVGVRSTEEIRRTLRSGNGQRQHRVSVPPPLALPDVALPIDPYVLGCWLGDGGATTGCITKPDEELFDRIAACGYQLGASPPSSRCTVRTVYGLRRQLRLAGLLGHKAIPEIYLRAGYSQRLALLRGLMDTDGSWNATRHQAVFMTTDKALALAVRELACTLGQRAVLHTTKQTGFGLTVEAYPVTFTPVGGLNPFALSRKANQVSVPTDKFSRRRIILSVEPIPSVPTQCIAVDSPDHTYLCTETMIPTHNTTTDAEPGSFAEEIVKLRYHLSAGHYLIGAAVLGLEPRDFIWIAQEKTAPYLVSVVNLTPADLDAGRALARAAMERYRDCAESGIWPGYSPDVETVHLSRYRLARQLEAAGLA